ncbi:hypothetical protein Pint_28013 [Pistacia integerrima]|uniref:Uncharacterized protein n=1 Tax=Pistacia integerrima TaxID=434235 RepID=A0ACC0YPC7_9ROSI|nr:hypothetical protein Pint_28013 [Pistacia integerrima]
MAAFLPDLVCKLEEFLHVSPVYGNCGVYGSRYVPRAARIGLEAVTVLKVNVEVVSVHVLQLTGNVIQMFVGIVGSDKSVEFYYLTVPSCGDGTLGIPDQKGDNYECRNMKLLLKQQQRVLLGRSDVSGWGAFLKTSVERYMIVKIHHFYSISMIRHDLWHYRLSQLFSICAKYVRAKNEYLNPWLQFVLDAYRKGDKLKFANHSPDPNCYAKVIMVAGDHRVGIFAKERISAGEELFYDYRYEPDRAPAWARKPEASGSKKEDAAPSSGRAKKLA